MTMKTATGIVLSSRIMGEADVRATVLTREHGKKTFLFKGLKKSTTRPKSASEPGTVISVTYRDRENRDIIVPSEFSIIRYFHSIRSNLEKITATAFMLELAERTTGYENYENSIFELLAGALNMLETTSHASNLSVFFTVHLLRLHGILPPVERCRKCGTRNPSSFSFDVSDLGLLCQNCSGGNRTLIDISARDFIMESLQRKFVNIDNGSYPDDISRQLLFYLSLFIEHYFSIEIRSKTLLLNS